MYYELLEQLTRDRRDARLREAEAERLTAAARTDRRNRLTRTLELMLRRRRTAAARLRAQA